MHFIKYCKLIPKKIWIQLFLFLIVLIAAVYYIFSEKIEEGAYAVINQNDREDVRYLEIYSLSANYYDFPETKTAKTNRNYEFYFDTSFYHIKRVHDGTLQFIKKDFKDCIEATCQTIFDLVKIKKSDPEFITYKESFDRYYVQKDRERTPFYQEVLRRKKTSDFLGETFQFHDLYSIKLMPLQALTFTSETLDRDFKFANLKLTKSESKKIKTYRFREYRPMYGSVGNIFSEAWLYLVPAKEDDIDLALMTDALSSIFYQDETVIFGNYIIGEGFTKPFLFYAQYDEAHETYILGHAFGNNRQLLDYYNGFKSIAETIELEEEVSLEDLTLTSAEFKSKYGIQYEEYIEEEMKITYSLREKILRLTDRPDIFYDERSAGTEDGYLLAHFSPSSSTLASTSIKIKRHVGGFEAIQAEFLSQSPKGKWIKNTFIHDVNPKSRSNLSYLKELQDDLYLEILFPGTGRFSEKIKSNFLKMLFIKQLEVYDFGEIPHIPKEAIPNIGKYRSTFKTKTEFDGETYQFKEGKTDLFGNLLEP